MRYEYPGGVMPHERHLIERFEDEILPYVEKHGPYIGELAMAGHKVAEEVILRHNGFMKGGPDQRPYNFRMLVRALKHWRREWDAMKRSAKAMSSGTVH